MTSTMFGFATTADDVAAGLDLTGTRALVTGGASGLGRETARVLAQAGAEVTIAVRDVAAGEHAAAAMDGDVRVAALDLADLASVAAFTAVWDEPLDILVANAGVMALPERTLTPAGWELQFATNHLGHFALATGLHECLAAARAKIVSLSSRGHLRSPVVFEDLHFARRPYDPWLAYGQSKTANVLFAVEATRRWAGDGITADAVHPGSIVDTHLARHVDAATLDRITTAPTYRGKSIAQGAATSVLVATDPGLARDGGRYFEDCHEAERLSGPDPQASSGVAPYALDANAARRLWDLSVELIG